MLKKTEGEEWVGVPSSGFYGSVAIWHARFKGFRFGKPIPGGTPGSDEEISTHLMGRSTAEWLKEQLVSDERMGRLSAAADPKLPSQSLRGAIRKYLETDSNSSMVPVFLRNPSTTTEELEQIAEMWRIRLSATENAVGQQESLIVLYEHPNVSRARREEMLDMIERGSRPRVSTTVEALFLRCATLHRDMTASEMTALAAHWERAVASYETQHQSGVSLPLTSVEVQQNLGIAAGRILSHPNTGNEIAARTMERAQHCQLPEVWASAVRAWMDLRECPREREWEMLERTMSSLSDPTNDVSQEAAGLAVSLVKNLTGESPHSRDGDVLLWCMEQSMFAKHLIETSPAVTARITWTRERVRYCLLSHVGYMRLYGIRGVEFLATQSGVDKKEVVASFESKSNRVGGSGRV